MQSLNRISVILLSLIGISTIIGNTQAQTDPLYYICPNTTTFARNSTYESNLRILLSSLASNGTPRTGFYNASVGRDPDDVYGLYLCRGDVAADDCQQCVNQATGNILGSCPVEKEAVVYYDNCLLRYSNVSVSPSLILNNRVYTWNSRNITGNQASIMDLVGITLSDLAAMAAGSSRKFAVKEVNYTSNSAQKLYTFMQCTPDLSTWECRRCLQYLVGDIPLCCNNRIGGRVLTPSCLFRYDNYPFYNIATANPSPPQPLPLAPTPQPLPLDQPPSLVSRGKRSDSRKMVISVSISCTIGLLLLLLGCYIYILRKRKKLKKAGVSETSQEFHLLYLGRSRNGDRNPKGSIEEEIPIESQDFPFIQLDIVHKATHCFSDENKLGEGGFGPVYKGTLEDGKDIAVKRLSRNSGQGLTEFMNEVTLIARVQHKNLVKLVGCCLEKNEKLLIYEYMPNKSLDLFLFDPNLAVQLDWQRRFSIIHGLARGLMYLHEDSRLKIIHRDVKVSNVLLDCDMNPKISDFGMARIFGGKQNQANTNRVVGTYGYMAPEYAMEGLFSAKSDVFSFGVIVLEIISGRRNNGFYLSEKGKSLLTYAWKMWSEGRGMELMDPLLAKSIIAAEVLKCIHIGLLCVQDDPDDRPSMSNVIVMLAGNIITLPRPLQPAFSVGRVVPISSESSSNKFLSVNHVTFSSILPR